MKGYYLPAGTFKSEGEVKFVALQDETDCDVGYYCATTYDGVFLLMSTPSSVVESRIQTG